MADGRDGVEGDAAMRWYRIGYEAGEAAGYERGRAEIMARMLGAVAPGIGAADAGTAVGVGRGEAARDRPRGGVGEDPASDVTAPERGTAVGAATSASSGDGGVAGEVVAAGGTASGEGIVAGGDVMVATTAGDGSVVDVAGDADAPSATPEPALPGPVVASAPEPGIGVDEVGPNGPAATSGMPIQEVLRLDTPTPVPTTPEGWAAEPVRQVALDMAMRMTGKGKRPNLWPEWVEKTYGIKRGTDRWAELVAELEGVGVVRTKKKRFVLRAGSQQEKREMTAAARRAGRDAGVAPSAPMADGAAEASRVGPEGRLDGTSGPTGTGGGGAPVPIVATDEGPEVATEATPFVRENAERLGRTLVRAYNVVATGPRGGMAPDEVAPHAEVSERTILATLQSIVTLGGMEMTRKGTFRVVDRPEPVYRARFDKLQAVSSQWGKVSYQKRSVLFALAALGRATEEAVRAQSGIKEASSGLGRMLRELQADGHAKLVDGAYELARGLRSGGTVRRRAQAEAAVGAGDAGDAGAEVDVRRPEATDVGGTPVAEGADPATPDATPPGVPSTPSAGRRERTFAMVKCGAVKREAVDAIAAMIRAVGLEIAAIRVVTLPREVAERLYEDHRDQPYYEGLIRSVTEGEVGLMRVEGIDAVRRWRELMGPTDPRRAPRGTVRGEHGVEMPDNAVHGSDSVASAARELEIVRGLMESEDVAF